MGVKHVETRCPYSTRAKGTPPVMGALSRLIIPALVFQNILASIGSDGLVRASLALIAFEPVKPQGALRALSLPRVAQSEPPIGLFDIAE
jgi:hypothetical protein